MSLSDGVIRPIGADAVRRIVAGQAVTDLASAVKELVDNSLDAGSKSINIRLFNQGADIVEVSDDGAGVPLASRPFLATAHATSKIRSFDDIYSYGSRSDISSSSSSSSQQQPLTLGFRGEALFCLANLSSKVIVATRTANEEMAQKLEFRRDGSLDPTSVATIPRKVGTTVAVVRLLDAVPVRRADMKRRMPKQRGRLLKWMEAYAIFSVGVRIHLMDMIPTPSNPGSCRESTCLATTTNSTSLEQTISSVLGPKFLASLCPVFVNLTSAVTTAAAEEVGDDMGGDEKKEHGAKDTSTTATTSAATWKLDGWIAHARPSSSTTDCSSSTSNARGQQQAPTRTAQYYCINGRPVELPKVTRMLNDLWRSFGQNKKPSCVLRLTLPGNSFDINLSPDKREVVLTAEQEVLQVIRDQVAQLWAGQTNGKFDMNNILLGAPQPGSTEEEEARNHHNDAARMGGNHDPQGGDADLGNDDSSSPGTFNRRYAFSHDFAKAKLQHEYNDGRVKRRRHRGDETDNNNNNSAAVSTTSSSGSAARASGETENAHAPANNQAAMAEQEAERPQKRVCVDSLSAQKKPSMAYRSSSSSSTSHHQQAAVATVTPSSLNGKATIGGGRSSIGSSSSTIASSRTSSPEKATNAERRQWHQVQSSFNNTSSPQDDDFQLEEIAAVMGKKQQKQAASSSSTAEKDSNGFNSRREGGPQQQQQQQPQRAKKIFGLERFGFQAIKRVSNDHQQSPPENGGVDGGGERQQRDRIVQPPRQDNQNKPPPAAAPKIRRVSSMVDDEEEEKEQEQESSVSHRRGQMERQESSSLSRARARSGAASPTTRATQDRKDDDDDDNDNQDRSSGGPQQLASKKRNSTVVWGSFKGTDSVIACSREHRLAARNRKIRYRDEIAKAEAATTTTTTTASLTKADFERNLTVIGQFNMGFILAKSQDNHLWILDQHACDERYNFEKLCEETVIHEQRLIAPLPLELAPCEELCVMDNMSIFENNGFRFKVDETKPPRHRLSLVALPHSGARDGRKAVQFGKEDVSALCAILGADGSTNNPSHEDVNGGGTGTDGSGMYGNNAVRRYAGRVGGGAVSDTADRVIARLPKAVAMFASRACRGSIMIGTALSETEMDRLIKNLANLSDPWHCAHGRTTLSHVGDLSRLLAKDERKASAHVAGPTVTVMSQPEDDENISDP